MKIVDILRRKDAFSVCIAVILGLTINSFIYSLASIWTSKIITIESDTQLIEVANDWRVDYLSPLVNLLLSILILEVVVRLVMYAVTPSKQKK